MAKRFRSFASRQAQSDEFRIQMPEDSTEEITALPGGLAFIAQEDFDEIESVNQAFNEGVELSCEEISQQSATTGICRRRDGVKLGGWEPRVSRAAWLVLASLTSTRSKRCAASHPKPSIVSQSGG